MSHRATRLKTIGLMSPSDRVSMARSKANTLTDRCVELERIHANNRFLIYGSVFGHSLQQTFAGNAFSALRLASFGHELIRLTALWDKPALDRVSIPEIVALLDDPAVQAQLRADFDVPHQTELNWLAGLENGRRFEQRLRHALALTRRVEASERLKALKAHRDKYLAHNLTIAPGPNARYGYERKLLRTSQHIALALSSVLENRGLDYAESRILNRRHAAEFWQGLKWELPPEFR
jgi:hypothetical protein